MVSSSASPLPLGEVNLSRFRLNRIAELGETIGEPQRTVHGSQSGIAWRVPFAARTHLAISTTGATQISF